MGSNLPATLFSRFAKWISRRAGRPFTFGLAVLFIVAWALTGPMFKFSDTWQLVINTSTTIITFLMVFVIQNTQNRDGEAIQVKLDELIRAIAGARNSMIDLEELEEADLDRIHARYGVLAEKARAHALRHRQKRQALEAANPANPLHNPDDPPRNPA